MMIAFALPVLASSLSFVVYGLTNPTLNPAVIFASLAWFNQLRFPLMLLPRLLAGWADFKIALQRMDGLLSAEEVCDYIEHVPDSDYAIKMNHASFKWDCLPPEVAKKKEKPTGRGWSKKNKPAMKKKDSDATVVPNAPGGSGSKKTESEPLFEFSVQDLDLTIMKGKLVAIVGSVGSGKSTILNSLIGETKLISGTVQMSGSVGFAPQQAWIQNATVKENILFGRPYDHQRYLHTIHTCALERDLELLPDGDSTEIGERGINLSGGQKQRVNLARLVYYNPDIVLMDDPLSAVDAHVGKFLFDQCINGALAEKT
ncbi:hypothetical protein HDU91_003113, partial [Kappamyces sp. JEL0680]